MPRSFTDSANRNWTIEVTLGSIQRVRSVTGLDLRHLQGDGSAVAVELDDPSKMKAVLAVLTEEQRQAAKDISIDELMNSLKTEQQSDAAVLAVYQATFDFFLSHGPELNDALGKTMKALESAQRHTKARMRTFLDSGRMDQLLEILTTPETLAQWVAAARDAQTSPAIALAMEEATERSPGNELPLFVRLCLERELTLPTTSPTASPSTRSPSATDSGASLASTPDRSPGESST